MRGITASRPVPRDPVHCYKDLVCAVVVQAVQDARAVYRVSMGERRRVSLSAFEQMRGADDWLQNGGLQSALDMLDCSHLRGPILARLDDELSEPGDADQGTQ